MKFYIFLSLSLIISTFSVAQSGAVDAYKYIVVDNQYEWQNEANQYRQNELMVFLLEKYGFTALRNNQVMPADFNMGTCNALAVKMDKSGTLKVNLDVWLEDCYGNKVFETKTGTGRTKDYRIAYNEAIRDAFESFEALEYKYDPNLQTAILNNEIVNEKTDVITNQVSTIQEKIKQKPEEVKEIIIQDEPDLHFEDKTVEVTEIKNRTYTDGILNITFYNNDNGISISQNGKKIGYARESAVGSFLVYTNDFSGIAYFKEDILILEYDDANQKKQIKILSSN